ncbi:CDP-glucose 4,6-dehydratase [Methylobacterium sp. PvP062]|uniref:CDP-glucose 4,6-dehydratase n=1 Tax=Methylobacterium radiotolerans TaxID=31998 RepID=A0ABV2N937_9HYPH|nr:MULTISPECIES: CDP-glucose 4,6-dehydratase [unclassified Methylobacterium]MBP2493761.1 CDP-glucose 4,6-dehydratase [Methylobacterium sp. PvP105]MBP2499866.1 CDP-glucose 4,6-dehydratase [Methylobacterium sp. PvP109]MCX7336289.1 CDP-glucose 4,6-dehydratase [Hyphomicrobiales bacterium]
MTLARYRGTRVLVTGHTGFKGAWLVAWLLDQGAEVMGLALGPPTDRPSLFRDLALADRMRSAVVDIRDAEAVREAVAAFRPEIVFHLAAQALVRRSYADPLETFAVNVMGTAHVLEAARHTDSVRAVVCVTSDKCYENREWVWGYRESDPLGGKDPYSASKAAAEIVAGSYRQALMPGSRLRLATARGGNVIGGGDWSEDRLVPDLVRAIRSRAPLVLRNPDAVRPWQHVLELLHGYLLLGARLLAADDAAVGAWNFGPARASEVAVRRLVEQALAAWGGDPIPVQIEASALREAGILKLDAAKAEAELGWRPRLGFARTVRLTMEWYRDYSARPTDARALVEAQIAEYARIAAASGHADEDSA